jgi:hypothetical protein
LKQQFPIPPPKDVLISLSGGKISIGRFTVMLSPFKSFLNQSGEEQRTQLLKRGISQGLKMQIQMKKLEKLKKK